MQSHRLVKYKIHTGSNFIKTVFNIYLGFQVIGCRTIEVMVVFQAGNEVIGKGILCAYSKPHHASFAKAKAICSFCTWGRKARLAHLCPSPSGRLLNYQIPGTAADPVLFIIRDGPQTKITRYFEGSIYSPSPVPRRCNLCRSCAYPSGTCKHGYRRPCA
jgi:hypothetical protein